MPSIKYSVFPLLPINSLIAFAPTARLVRCFIQNWQDFSWLSLTCQVFHHTFVNMGQLTHRVKVSVIHSYLPNWLVCRAINYVVGVSVFGHWLIEELFNKMYKWLKTVCFLHSVCRISRHPVVLTCSLGHVIFWTLQKGYKNSREWQLDQLSASHCTENYFLRHTTNNHHGNLFIYDKLLHGRVFSQFYRSIFLKCNLDNIWEID